MTIYTYHRCIHVMTVGNYAREAHPVRGTCGTHGGPETAKVRDVRRTVGRRGLNGVGAGKRVDGVSPGRLQRFRYQRRSVDDCSPGLGGMAQDGGTRSGTFHGGMDRCSESRCWTTACSFMPERDGKHKEEIAQSKRASASSLAIAD